MAMPSLQLYQQRLHVRSPTWQTDQHRALVGKCREALGPGLPPCPAWQDMQGQLTLLPRLPLACLEKSSATMSAWPSWEARCSGVTP